ncbi:MAG: family 10 glycosylhydrolase [candidate division WOR-3 bacterium]
MIILTVALFGFQKGMWVRASSAASPDSISGIISLAEEMGITDIYYQAVVGGYAYYKSSILPRSQYLSRVSGPDYDPLDSLIKAAHQKGIRVHAWVNSLLVWSGDEPPESTSHIIYSHPDWSLRDVLGRPMFQYSPETWRSYGLDGIFMDPANPEVRAWLSGVCGEIARDYPVDGIHLDFIRFPGTWWGLPDRDETVLFRIPEAERLRWMELVRYPRLSLEERYLTWCFWRLNEERELAVYQTLKGVSDALSAYRRGRGLALSAAVWANPGAAGFRVAQSWWRWGEIVDYLVLMSYTNDTGLFSDYLSFGLSKRPDAVFGIGFLWPGMEAEAAWEEAEARSRGARGISYFDYTRLRNEVNRGKLRGYEAAGAPKKAKDRGGSIKGSFSDTVGQGLTTKGKNLIVPGEDVAFADWLLSLSLNPSRDLARMGMSQEEFSRKVSDDVGAFRAIEMAVFPVGDELIEPPSREISFAFLPYEGDNPDEVKKRAKELRELPSDTTIYPKALDPLAKAVFSAKKGKREICPVPDGVYVFELKRAIKGGKMVRMKDVPPDLLPVYIGWTLKTRLERSLFTKPSF